MKSKLQMLAASVLMTASALWLTSCSSDDVAQGGTSKADLSLTLKINTGNVGSRATAWTSDPAGADKDQTENKINNLTVGIFSSDGNTVKTIVELTAGDATGNTLSQDGKTARIVTTSLKSGDQVLVAANAPKGLFAGVANVNAFEAISEDAKNALTDGNDETKEYEKNIPMYGKSSLTTTDNANFTTSDPISVQHQLAKITLDELKVDFNPNGAYQNAKFTPKEFFLVNVPTKLAFSTAAWVTGAGHLHGMSSTTYSNLTPAPEWGGANGYKEYLSASAVGPALAGTSTYANKSYFYVTPCDATGDSKMKLIIAGDFDVDGTGANSKTVFYPVNLNATYKSDGSFDPATNGGSDTFKVYPNKNYKCKVTIKTIGTIDPTQNLDPQSADVTITVANFVDAEQSTTFE